MRLAGRLLATIGVGLLLTGPSVAQGFLCEHAPAIVSLSNSILTKREELTGFTRRNAPAATAAYLSIWYAPLNDGDAESLLSDLVEDGARGVDEVAFSWSYAMDDGAVTERLLGPDALSELLTAGSRTAIRALMREGHDDELLDAIAALPEGATATSIYAGVAAAILDYSDEDKAGLAQKALDRGTPVLAAALTATQAKGAKAWAAFAKKIDDPEFLSQITQFVRWMPGMMGLPELPPAPDQSVSNPAMREKFHDIFIAAAMSPQLDFLGTLANQSGNLDEIHPAAMALRSAIKRGDIERDGPFGPAWLLVYRQLLADWGDIGELRTILKSFEVPLPVGGETPLALLDALLAAEALSPYLNAGVSEPPSAPPEMSNDGAAKWPQWLDIAARLKADPTDPTLVADDATLLTATELLLWSGNSDAVARLIEAAPATLGVTNLAGFAAIHLDRLCESYLYHPAEAVQQWPVYKFDG